MKYIYTVIIASLFCLRIISVQAYHQTDVVVVRSLSVPEKKVKIYPNPVNKGGTFTVEIPEETGELTISIYNTVGKVIHSVKTSEKKVEINAPNAYGIYLIRFVEKQKVITVGKIVVKE
ncbi:MAG: T9SS type A sorting domain-containing protein [Bacteroidales bacterium]|nr:T9SS type A sorting domain-containing protein [Bacteroidales bacterium]